MKRVHIEEAIFKALMIASILIVVGCLASVFISVLMKGVPAISLEMVTQTPKGGYYLGKEGGILNAIIGSLYLAIGATLLSLVLALPLALYLSEYLGETRTTSYIRRVLDILCGIPSIVYGAFAFTIMITVGVRASLGWGIITVSMFEFPYMTRAIDEVLKKVPVKMRETSLALGLTRWETASRVVFKQALPGILTAVIIGFGRAIGDAAAVLLTAGYTDNIPTSLGDPVATLPLAVFFQLSVPIAEVQQRAYAAGAILLFIVLGLSVLSRWGVARLMKNVVR
jgi:phosphate transport system permease protein